MLILLLSLDIISLEDFGYRQHLTKYRQINCNPEYKLCLSLFATQVILSSRVHLFMNFLWLLSFIIAGTRQL